MDEENVKKRIRALLEELQANADPVLLNRYRSVFRKEVSFFRRSYLAAYLLLLAEEGRPPARRNRRDTHEGRENRGKYDSRQENPPPASIPEEESARLFINIGRNRKVFPREILGLIGARTQVSRDDIGNIRILDNYSFVQVRTAAADTIIAALDGQSFKGKTLTVNYARIKKEGGVDMNAGTGEIPQESDD